MLNRLERLTQRVGGSNEFIDQWLHARKELLVSYCTLVGLKPNKEKHTPLNEKALDNFCHNLVDYLSAGHFHLYQRIIDEVAGINSPKKLIASKIYPALELNTEAIMAFHDSYTENDIDDENAFAFHYALSDIGEALDARFQLEDQLIILAFEPDEDKAKTSANEAHFAKPA